MTNSVKIDDKNIATFDIKIDSKVVKDAYERTLKAYASNVNIAGFRRGKAPAPIVEKYVGQERIKAEVIDRLFPSEFQKVVDENKLDVAFNPSIEKMDFELGKDVELKVSVELKPEVKLGQYKDNELEYEEFKNEPDALEKELEQVQQRFATLKETDRPATNKDTVVFDFEGFIGDEKIEHGEGKNYSLNIAHSNFIPGFAEALVGHSKGEEFTIDVEFPADYHEEKLKGAKAQFKIKMNDVKERILPELNDELAKKAGKDTLELLKEDIQKYLENLAKNENSKRKSEVIFNKVLDTTQINIQDTMLDREYQAIMDDAREQAKYSNQDFDKLVEKEGKENIEKRFYDEAKKRITNSLIIEKIAREENIRADQKDIMNQINQTAAMYGMAPVQFFEEIRKNPSSLAVISQQIVAGKVNDFLIENNKFSAKN